MTPAEFAHLIETHGISLQRAIDWRASIDSPALFAWGPTALAAVERLASKAGWKREPMVSENPPTRTGDPAHYSSTEDGGEPTTEGIVAIILRYDSSLTPEQARDLVEKFRELYRKTTEGEAA